MVNEAIRVCREHFSDPDLNVNRLADELAMDRSTLRRIFKQQMCMTPSDYLAKLRIQHALAGANPAAACRGGGPLRIFRRQLLLPGDSPRRRRQSRQLPRPLTVPVFP